MKSRLERGRGSRAIKKVATRSVQHQERCSGGRTTTTSHEFSSGGTCSAEERVKPAGDDTTAKKGSSDLISLETGMKTAMTELKAKRGDEREWIGCRNSP